MKKKIISFYLIFAIIMSLMATVEVLAFLDFPEGEDKGYRYFIADEQAIIMYILDKSVNGDIVVPAELGGYPVLEIYSQAFEHCKNITEVEISYGIKRIATSAFRGCTNLTNINIPNSTTIIGGNVFAYCENLTSINIPDSVVDIYKNAFLYSSVEEINVDDENEIYSSIDGVLFSKDKKTLITYPGGKKDTQYLIPEGVDIIDVFSFPRCHDLRIIEIPSSVTEINDYFNLCYALTEINVNNENNNYSSIDGVLFSKDKKTIMSYPMKKQEHQYSIPESATSIGDEAFYGCSNLYNVTISGSVTSVGEWAFYECTNLANITIPKNVTSIGKWAFSGYSNLKDVYYTGTEEEWNNIEIGAGNNSLTDATIHFIEDELISYISDYGKDGDDFLVTSFIDNETDSQKTGTLYTAVYNSDGTLKACGVNDVDVDSKENTNITAVLSCDFETGDTIKTYVWDENMLPIAEVCEVK